jgi:hypothetical protein
MVDVMGDNLKANPVAGETRWASSSTDAQQVGAEHLTSDVPGLAEIFKMVWYPKVLESLSPTHRFLILQGCAYTGAGLVFMVSPWLGTILLTFGQLKVDPCPPETRNLTLLEEGEAVCGPKWAGGKTADDLLSDDTESANCMCDQERTMMQFAGFFVSLVGYLYIQFARGNSLHFVAATTLNRLLIVPVSFARAWLARSASHLLAARSRSCADLLTSCASRACSLSRGSWAPAPSCASCLVCSTRF